MPLSDTDADDCFWLIVDSFQRTILSPPPESAIPGPSHYRLSVESGLRANELRSLLPPCFQFANKLATVTVEAGNRKRRRRDELPLRPETAAQLKAHITTKLPTASVFRLPSKFDMAQMIRQDLAAARSVWRQAARASAERVERERSKFLCPADEEGRKFDFHCLRHTFLTNLARSGVHPKLAQQLARHSSIVLTMDRYSHVTLSEQADALDLLPDLSAACRQAVCATSMKVCCMSREDVGGCGGSQSSIRASAWEA